MDYRLLFVNLDAVPRDYIKDICIRKHYATHMYRNKRLLRTLVYRLLWEYEIASIHTDVLYYQNIIKSLNICKQIIRNLHNIYIPRASAARLQQIDWRLVLYEMTNISDYLKQFARNIFNMIRDQDFSRFYDKIYMFNVKLDIDSLFIIWTDFQHYD
jgi:hypothetical protein